jgi:hypothetical protein
MSELFGAPDVCWLLDCGTAEDNYGDETMYSRHMILPFLANILRDE